MRNHYVPQFLQRPWVNPADGKLRVFKRTERGIPVKPPLRLHPRIQPCGRVAVAPLLYVSKISRRGWREVIAQMRGVAFAFLRGFPQG